MCDAVTVNLYRSEQFGAFILVTIVYCWPPLWSASRQKSQKMFPSVWLSVIFVTSLSEGLITPLSHTHTHTHIHTVFPFFFALSRLPLPFLSYSASPGCVRQWHSVVLCGRPTSGTAVSHKSASSFDRYRQGLSLCLWICATYCIFICLSQYTSPFVNPSVPPPPFSTQLYLTLLFLFTLPWFSPGEFKCPQWADYLWRDQYSPFSVLFTAYPVQYYRCVHIYHISRFKVIIFKWDIMW